MLTEALAGGGPDLAPEANDNKKLRYTDADFLRLVGDERRRSIGFGEGDTGELARVRIKSQEYRQGKINDLKVIKGRSTAVDSALSDAIDTVMPDLMEVFFGGDDVVTFDADGQGDEIQAREESDVVSQVVFGQNDAFRAFHDAFQDALLNRTGIFYWWWEDDERQLGSQTASDAAQAAAIAAMFGQGMPWAKATIESREDGSIAMSFAELRGRVVFKAAPSEDFTVASDTVVLRDTAYCALRDRPRIQDLIKRGVDKDLARSLPHYTTRQDEMEHARDQAGETDQGSADGLDDMRIVEVRTHFIRVDAYESGEPQIWRVETDGEETIFLQKECVTQIPFGGLTPYLSAHRFHGESLFDKLAEVQRIKTVLLRMLLDSGYFALNQRMEVSLEAANEFTISDLLNNAPNVPVRSTNGNAVRPLAAGELGFDVMGALEFMSTVAEQRSGIVRNAQGLNPDTLHETATGAMQMAMAAQKRVRMICRVFAETGVKDLFLGVHQLLREQFTAQHRPISKKVGQQWKDVRPDTWQEREALTVHVGVGSANRQHDLEVQNQGIALAEKVIELQGGVNGPFVTGPNIFNRLKAYSRAMGEKSPELYWTDPGDQPMQMPNPGQGAAMAKLQGEQAIAQTKAQAAAEAAHLKVQAKAQADQQKLVFEQQQAQQRLAGELAIQRDKMQGELALNREKAVQAAQLQRQEMFATIALRQQQAATEARQVAQVEPAVEKLPGGANG